MQRASKPQLVLRWFSGAPLDGQYRTNASWFHRSHGDRPVLHPTGRAMWWHHQAWALRGVIRGGVTVAVPAAAMGLVVARTLTLAVLGTAAAASVGLAGWWVWRKLRHLPHRWKYERPLRRAIARKIGGPPPKLDVPADRSYARISLPMGSVFTAREWEEIDGVVSTLLALEDPARDYQPHGAHPYVRYLRGEPPPKFLTWENIADMVARRGEDEMIIGLGKRGVKVSASLAGDSPHVGYNMGSGGGKTNLGSFAALQFIHDGAIAAIIDLKLISYPWARGLPNVCYAGTITEIHDLLVGLGNELQRRNEVSLAGLQPSGAIEANVGPRILLFAEELNYVVPKLKRYWDDMRRGDKTLPKRSPALDAIADIAFAGRQVLMHVVFIGQMLTAAATGANDSSVRGNIGIACMARYRETGWRKMSDLPMPPVPEVEGRIQVVTAAGIRETQVPYLYLDDKKDRRRAAAAAEWARQYAVSGTVSPLPSWMPGAVAVPRVPAMASVGQETSHQGFVPVTPDPVPPREPGLVTIREAWEAGLFPTYAAARRYANRKLLPVRKDGPAWLYRITDITAAREQR